MPNVYVTGGTRIILSTEGLRKMYYEVTVGVGECEVVLSTHDSAVAEAASMLVQGARTDEEITALPVALIHAGMEAK